jgi:hypothetical protein
VAGDRIGNWREGFGGMARDCPLANGTGEPVERGRMLVADQEDA